MNDLLKQAIVVFITIIFTMAGYWIMIGRDFVTRAEVDSMINNNHRIVQFEIDQLAESRKEIAVALDKNTEAITELKVAIAKLNNGNQTASLR